MSSKKKKKINLSIIAVSCILVLIGCNVQRTNVRTPVQNEYAYQSAILHPRFYIYHDQEDSSKIYYSIQTDEILFSRTDPEASFFSNLKFSYRLYERGEDLKTIIDSSSFSIIEENTNMPSIDGNFVIPLPAGKDYTLMMAVQDVNRKSGAQENIYIDKTNRFSRQNFLIIDEQLNPLFHYQKNNSGPLSIFSSRNDNKGIKYGELADEISFPPPAFSERRPETPNLPQQFLDTIYSFEIGKNYFITCDPERKIGVSISVRDEYFPEVKTYAKMAETLRYISSKNEYEYINEGSETKKHLDEFWLECGGSNDRSRQLIQTFYGRIESSNYFFSNVIPGWKTDRGMVLIIYGTPNRIKSFGDTEVWIYGEEGNINSLSFTFNRKSSPYSDQHFELERNGEYKKSWQLAVTSWRNGRIYNR